jgi:CO/xanthine dehydrogenase FAD-binding subunit
MRHARPSTLADALASLADGGVLLGGGTVLVPEMAGAPDQRSWIDLQGIPTLQELEVLGDFLSVGAMVTLARVAASPLVTGEWNALAQAALAVGNPNVRRAATVGGNLAWGGDLRVALLVLDAIVDEAGAGGPCALITSIRLPREEGRRSAYVKFAWRAASGKTIVAVAASIDGSGSAPRLAASGVAGRAARLPRAEAILGTGSLGPEVIEEAARVAKDELRFEQVDPPGERYRRRLIAEGVRRTIAAVYP